VTGAVGDGGAAGTPPGPAPSSPPPRVARTGLWVAAVVVVLIVGVTAAAATRRDAQADAERHEALLADQTGNLAVSTMQQLLAAVGGVSGLPDPSGTIAREAFDSYVEGVVAASPLQTLAYAPVVTAAERSAVEAEIGRPLRDTPAGPPAPARAVHLPVVWVTPPLEATRDLIGFDLAADPVRGPAAARARDEGTAIITDTLPSQPSRRPAVFLVHPVYRPGLGPDATVAERRQALVGYVATGFLGEQLMESLEDQLSSSLGIEVADVTDGRGGPQAVLAVTEDDPAGGSSVVRRVAGRVWRITVEDHRPVATAAPWWLLAGTIALAGALTVLGLRARRHQREVSRQVRMVGALAGLGRSLTAADGVDEVVGVVEAEVPGVLEAESARLALLPPPAGAGPPSGGATGDGDADGAPPPGQPGPSGPPAEPGDGHRQAGATSTRWLVTDEAGAAVAVLDVTWRPPGRPDDLALASLATVGELCRQTLRRARLSDTARRDAVTSRLLGGLAEAAATAGTADQVARTLVDRAVEGADSTTAHIGLLGEDGRSLMVTHHSALDAVVAERHSVQPLDLPWPLATCVREARPVLLGDLDEVARRFPEIADGIRSSGIVAVACLPLLDEAGTPFGAVSVTWDEPRHFGPARLAALGAIADLCASSLGRARATDMLHARASRLGALAAHLSAARTFDHVGEVIVDHAAPALGADLAIVGVVEQDQFRMLAPSGPALDVVGHYADLDLDGDFPGLIALRRREIVTFTSLDAVPEPRVAADLETMGLHAGACAPLIDAGGAPLGVLVALWSQPPAFDADLLARVAVVADLCRQSAERAQLADAEHRVRRDLQDRVLPRIPAVPPFEVAARYSPAARSVGMGGDWYDGIELGPGRLCVVLGDVAGHGVEAVAEMVHVRTVVHTLAAGGMPLPEVLGRASTEMQRDARGYATLLMAVIDAERGTMEYVTAGHPPPLLRGADGSVTVLDGGHSSLLGIDLSPRPVGRAAFPPGATLAAFTDGLVEMRDETIDRSIAALADRMASAPDTGADRLADHLLASRSEPARDDVALVVVHRPGRRRGAGGGDRVAEGDGGRA
jgi:serine phosphatase RsbU (regulator of sigma subunit)/CHASE1-domain containing sensor protein